jgi:hypothetical protein
MGPGSLHANFCLAAKSTGGDDSLPWHFDLSIEHRRGYGRYDFTFNEGFANSEDALNDLLAYILTELDLGYLIGWIERGR